MKVFEHLELLDTIRIRTFCNIISSESKEGLVGGVKSVTGRFGPGSFRSRVVSVPCRFGPGSFRPGSFRPESFRPWVVSANLRGSFRPDFFYNPRLVS